MRLAFACLLVSLLAVASAAQSFPVRLETRFGDATIPAKPRRIVSISFIGHDFLLSLGETPAALRNWYGNDPSGVWPWALEVMGERRPAVLRGGIDIEAVAALEPDLIAAQWSGITEREYALLSRIAPTLAPPAGFGDYGTPWQLMLRRLGAATGTADRAEAVIARIGKRFEELRASHPDWQGASAAMVWAGQTGAFTSRDIRGRFLEDLGFQVPAEINTAAGVNSFHALIPAEAPAPIDADVLIWLDYGGSAPEIARMPLRPTLRAYREGREIHADPLLAAALSHSSPLSLDYALDRLVPLLEAASDGSPATPVPGMAEAGLLPGDS
ncbi:ABC transporter substrate-binding protein [Leisingera sp. M523]|nr:ABC transporter substrate-binding protein [Leisingera sp. M523]